MQRLQKRAVVYLPYGYNDWEKYNVFYLMHGGWSNETTTLGTPEAPSAMKNVLDNSISDGKISPLIVVCPTYNNTSSEDSAREITNNELINDLIPAVEGKYSSYAESVSTEELIVAANPVLDFYRGISGRCLEAFNNPAQDTFNNGTSWTQTRESILPEIQAEIDAINKRLES